MVHISSAAAIATLALCLHAAVAYPASMERFPGDTNNFLPLRNSPSRDLDRFIGFCEDYECGLPDAEARRGGLNRGRAAKAKRGVSAANRPDGEHAASPCGGDNKCGPSKKRSLNRLEPGHLVAGKRGGLDRCEDNECGGGDERSGAGDDPVSAVRSSGTAVDRIGTAVDRIGTAVDRIGTAVDRSSGRSPFSKYARLQHRRRADFAQKFDDDDDDYYYCVGCSSTF